MGLRTQASRAQEFERLRSHRHRWYKVQPWEDLRGGTMAPWFSRLLSLSWAGESSHRFSTAEAAKAVQAMYANPKYSRFGSQSSYRRSGWRCWNQPAAICEARSWRPKGWGSLPFRVWFRRSHCVLLHSQVLVLHCSGEVVVDHVEHVDHVDHWLGGPACPFLATEYYWVHGCWTPKTPNAMQELIKNSARATVEVRRRLLEIAGEDMGFTISSISYQKWRLILDNMRGNHQELAVMSRLA